MTRTVVATGPAKPLHEQIHQNLFVARPLAIGIASAFVSTGGVAMLKRLLEASSTAQCHLIAGTDHYITHPRALVDAQSHGWKVRLANSPAGPGIFHPKFMVGGSGFAEDDSLIDLSFSYVGSANLTFRAFSRNIECGLVSTGNDCDLSAAREFSVLWRESRELTDERLKNYSAEFADRNRRRSPLEMEELGIGDTLEASRPADQREQSEPENQAIETHFASAAWAGLQSFTGEFKFQIEFPRAAGEVIHQILGDKESTEGRVDVFCTNESQTIPMQYRFYQNNSMFRLNVPNDAEGVAWARENREGIALVERGLQGGAPLRLSIIKPGQSAEEIMSRSYVLGTWGRTTTRLFGWY